MQVGLEYIGEVDDYAVSEVVLLAKKVWTAFPAAVC